MAKSQKTLNDTEAEHASAPVEKLPMCGIVMPISKNDAGSESHWNDVKGILTEAISEAGFQSRLVSYADDVGVIQKRIVENLYNDPIVVCDVSGKNANVMLELGMRLAFDKPVIIVKDYETDFSFDTSPIEHLQYPRDLRFTTIVSFKSLLAEKIRGTNAKSQGQNYSTFLKHFGSFAVAEIETQAVPGYQILSDKLDQIMALTMRPSQSASPTSFSHGRPGVIDQSFDRLLGEFAQFFKMCRNNPDFAKSEGFMKKVLAVENAVAPSEQDHMKRQQMLVEARTLMQG